MSNAEEAAVSTYTKLLSAWNSQDAAAMAALFAEGGIQVGFDGSEAQGPKTIHQHLAPIFRDHPTKRFVYVVREVHPLAEDVALLRAIAGMVPRDSLEIDESKNVIQSLAVRREHGAWRIALFQNTRQGLMADPKQSPRCPGSSEPRPNDN
jgi:uncharacterized protein (TIGR02246 family)